MATLVADSAVSARDRFSFTLFLATALHAVVLLGIGISTPDEKAPQRSLEVTLAQHRSEEAPDKADFLAQANQQGSGDLDEKKEISTTEMADFHDNVIREIEPQQSASEQQEELLSIPRVITTVGSSPFKAVILKEQQEAEKNKKLDETLSQIQRDMEIASLEAQYKAKRQIYANRPRKRQLTAASTKEARDALYLDNWRQRIEEVGNINYPKKLKVYGNLQMLVAINADGTVNRLKVLKSSGYKNLDSAAIGIVRMAAPFQRFPQEIRKDTDILEIIRTWKFEKGDYLSSY